MNTTTLAQEVEMLFSNADVEGTTASALAEARALWNEICHGAAGDADAIARLGTMFGLDFHRVLALLLKYEWERVLEPAHSDAKGNEPSHHADIDADIQALLFTPDSTALYRTLTKQGHVPNGFAYDPRSLADTIREMLLIDVHLLAIGSVELQTFADRSRRSLELLQHSTGEIQTVFYRKKREWLARQDELGEWLLRLERRRLDNANLTQEWMAIFGEAYIALNEESLRVDNVQRRISFKLTNPELTRDALEQLVRETEAAKKAELRRLRHRLSIATNPVVPLWGGVVPEDAGREYRRTHKAVLREIWLLIHPDKLAQQAHYSQLTDDQQSFLSELWHRAMDVKTQELGMHPASIQREYRSLTILRDILDDAKSILENYGLQTDVRLMITGDTVEEQIAWLTRSIQRLDDELDGVDAEFMALRDDRDLQERAALLKAPPSQQQAAKEKMLDRARTYRERADRMEIHLAQLYETQDRQN
jgi:hypothetical protein